MKFILIISNFELQMVAFAEYSMCSSPHKIALNLPDNDDGCVTDKKEDHHTMKPNLLLAASIYFLVIGTGDLLFGLATSNVIWWRIIIDIVFCFPLAFRHRFVNILAGSVIVCVFEYLLIDITCRVDLGGHTRNMDHVFFSSGPLLTFHVISLIAAILLVMLGMKDI